MVLDDIFERFATQSPVTVMARAALEHALDPGAIDALFEEFAQRQYHAPNNVANDLVGGPLQAREGPQERRSPEGEDPTVGCHQPVAATAW